MHSVLTLDLADAEALTNEARRAAGRAGVPQNIAIVDHAGALLCFVRMDGAKWIAGPIAINKARTAAGIRGATADLAPRTVPGEAGHMIQMQDGGRFTTLGGGVPVMRDGQVAGAIGVSGGSVAEDIAIAEAAVSGFSRT